MIRVFKNRAGFALPTILIASMVMLIVLITSVSATSSVRSGLDGQYYVQLAREAAESGLARANGCLQDGGYVPAWTSSRLYPNTSCTGGNPCTNTASCFVTQRPTIRTTFNVSPPENLTIAQVIRSEGKVELLRASTGEVWRTYTYIASARVSVDLNLNTVAFGYDGGNGAYFATIGADGVARGVGYNGSGQLGNGTYNNNLTPAPFKVPAAERPVSVFTNFMSAGYSTYILASSGKIYGSGFNAYGQLGDGTTTSNRPTPVLYNMPAGKLGKSVALNGFAAFALTTDDNVYATGMCSNGLLGSNYTIAGCSHRSTPIRVALPTPTASDLNTIPTSNIATDYISAYIRMQGGRVYGWGGNYSGQLITNNNNDSSAPVKIGNFGDAGQSKAAQVAFDGITVMVLDDNGDVYSGGSNSYGILGGEGINIRNASANKCLDNANGDDVSVWLYTCNNGINQEWTFRGDGSIYFPKANKCLDNKNADGVTIWITTCSGGGYQQFQLDDMKYKLSRFGIPASAGNIVKIVTDAWFASVLTDTGEVWSAGINNKGQLGNGATAKYQPFPVKFILPGGVTAKDVYSAAYNPDTSPFDYNNTFVIGSDGKVYGAGSNAFGQLGDGTTTSRSTPVAMQVINGTTVRAKQVVTGYGTTVVLTEDRKVYTVGNNANGQLGDGTTTNSSTPKANRYTNVLPVTSF